MTVHVRVWTENEDGNMTVLHYHGPERRASALRQWQGEDVLTGADAEAIQREIAEGTPDPDGKRRETIERAKRVYTASQAKTGGDDRPYTAADLAAKLDDITRAREDGIAPPTDASFWLLEVIRQMRYREERYVAVLRDVETNASGMEHAPWWLDEVRELLAKSAAPTAHPSAPQPAEP